MNAMLIVLLVCSALLWIGLVGTLVWVQSRDPLSRRIAEPFAEFISIGLWMLLAVIAVVIGPRVGISVRAFVSVLILLTFSFLAALVTVQLFGRQAAPRWLVVVPSLPPVLFGLLATLANRPNRAAFSSHSSAGIMLGTILFVSLLPWFFAIQNARRNAAEVRRMNALNAADK